MAIWMHLKGIGASAYRVAQRRKESGPLRPNWSLWVEVLADYMKTVANQASHLDLIGQRNAWAQMALPSSVDWKLHRQRTQVGGVPAEWFIPRQDLEDRLLLYIHGGGYIFGSAQSHQELIGRLALASRAKALAVEYRLAPEHRFPAAVDDVVAVYRDVVTMGFDPKRIVVGGDSAGGALTAALFLTLRDSGERLPAAGAMICPWIDLTAKGGTMDTNEPYDYSASGMAEGWIRGYLGDADPRHPLASPIFADLHGLPPLLIQAGGAEVLLDQVTAFAERARAAGVDVDFEVTPDMMHVWHVLGSFVPEARQAITRIGAFARRHTPIA